MTTTTPKIPKPSTSPVTVYPRALKAGGLPRSCCGLALGLPEGEEEGGTV